MSNEAWQQRILDAIEELVGGSHAGKVAADWNEHAAREHVEITFLGPYSSGKSSLLRRLVVDAGEQVPEWLTVSARRETFELNEVQVGELTFTDVPGFGAGSELHDELAQDARALSDAFLLVVPPQLLTTNRELVGSIVSGEYFFGQPRPGSDEAFVAAIAQADSLGIDPEDDPDGMLRLAERKRTELIDQLETSAGVPLPGVQVICVAADPYEEQARQSQPERSAFDAYRQWDGIDSLVAVLSGLPERMAELRRWASVRYFCAVATAVASEVQAVLDETESAAEELRARQREWEQQKTRVDAVVTAAREDLHTRLVTLSRSLSEELGTDEDESRTTIDDRTTSTIDQWARRWDGQLDLVLGEAQVQVYDRLTGARAKRTQEFLRSMVNDPSSIDAPEPNSRLVGLLNNIRGDLFDITRRGFELHTGVPLDDLLAKSARAVSTKTKDAKKAIEVEAADGIGDTIAKAQKLNAGLQMADGILTVITILDAQYRQADLDAKRRREREEALDRIERNASSASTDIVDGADGQPGWRARADAALDLLRDQLGLTGSATPVNDLFQSVAERQALVSELHVLVATPPS